MYPADFSLSHQLCPLAPLGDTAVGDREEMQTHFLSNFLLCSYQLKASDVARRYYCMMRYPGDGALSEFYR